MANLQLGIIWCVFLCFITGSTSLSIYAEDESFLENPKYYTYEELSDLFRSLERDYPSIAKLHSIGKSVQQRDLWALEINFNVTRREVGVPMFKYVANMHGDETVGYQLLIYLAQYLLKNYNRIERVTNLIRTTDIFLMPSMNPDGYSSSKEGQCETPSSLVGRGNANRVDLNRDFPDQFVLKTNSDGYLMSRQRETLAMMSWITNQPFVLSANLHGGAIVASYPFDDFNATRDGNEESRSPDDRLFKYLAFSYAQHHPIMKSGKNCEDNFPGGIINGAKWYVLLGGMQDFNYVHSNCFEITLELSCCKFPPASELPTEWKNNKDSLLVYMENVHWGIKGLVLDEDGYGIPGAKVSVQGIRHDVRTSDRGEYWRLLLKGTYNVTASAPGYLQAKYKTVTVRNEPLKAETLNFRLEREEMPGNYFSDE